MELNVDGLGIACNASIFVKEWGVGGNVQFDVDAKKSSAALTVVLAGPNKAKSPPGTSSRQLTGGSAAITLKACQVGE